jgi:hypothetical protein
MSLPLRERKLSISPWRAVIIAMTVCILLICCGITCFNIAMHDFFHDVFAGKQRAINSPAEWPNPLKKLVEDAKSANIDAQVFEVHCMCEAYESEYIWRMKASPELLDFLIKRWKLSPDIPPIQGIFCGKSMISGDSTPSWWTPTENADTQFYVCELTLKGEKGERVHLAHDKKRGCLFVWFWNNW